MDPDMNDDELKHIKKSKEIAEQFDYSTSQVNELDESKPKGTPDKDGKKVPTESSTPATAPPEVAQEFSGAVPSSTIFRLRYLVIIVAMLGVNYSIGSLLPEPVAPFILLAVYIIATSLHTAALKSSGSDELLENDRMKMIALLAGNPIISHALYYLQLRKHMPKVAAFAGKTGFKVLGLVLLCVAIAAAVIVSQSWGVQHGPQMKNAVMNIKQDALTAETAVKNQDISGLRKSCQAIIAHVGDMRKVQEHPDQKIREKILEVEDMLAGGAANCVTYTETKDQRYGQQSIAQLNEAKSSLTELSKMFNEGD